MKTIISLILLALITLSCADYKHFKSLTPEEQEARMSKAEREYRRSGHGRP
jgi:hypothetical protein